MLTAPADVRASARQLAAARAVLGIQFCEHDQVGLAFVGGSLAVGLGHDTSDLDLYLVGERLPDVQAVYEQDRVDVHVTTVDPKFVHELIHIGSAYRVSGIDRSQISIEPRTLHALVRLVTGTRLRVSPAWAAELPRLRIDVVRQVLVARHANINSSYAEDVIGALRSGDPLTAISASALALTAAAEVALAAAGDLYVGDKFLFRRLARTPVTAPWSGFLWKLLNRTVRPDLGDAQLVCDSRLRAANVLIAASMLDGWDLPLTELPPPPAARVRRGGQRSPFFTPMRFTDGWALIGPGKGYLVTEDVVRLWLAMDGRSTAGVYHWMSQRVPHRARGELVRAMADLAAIEAVRGISVSSLGLPHGTNASLVEEFPPFDCHPKVAKR